MRFHADNLLLHIGYHKTATTWLQNQVFHTSGRGFSPVILRQSACLLSSVPVARKFIYHQDGTQLSSLHFDAQVFKTALRQELDCTRHGVPVISHERLSGNPHSGGFDSRDIACRLHAVFPAAKILLVIREQASMIVSTYLQYLKLGGLRTLESYIQQRYDGRLPMFSLHYFEYHFLIRQYQQLFGSANVLVLPHELFCHEPRQFIRQLGAFSGAVIPDDLDFARRINVGPNKLIEYRLRILNLFAKHNSVNAYTPLYSSRSERFVSGLKSLLSTCISEEKERAFVQKKVNEVRRLVSSYYRASNQLTNQLTGLDLSLYGYQ